MNCAIVAGYPLPYGRGLLGVCLVSVRALISMRSCLISLNKNQYVFVGRIDRNSEISAVAIPYSASRPLYFLGGAYYSVKDGFVSCHSALDAESRWSE